MEQADKQFFLEEANRWQRKAEEHIKLADFCTEQADRFLGRVAMEEGHRPELVVLEGGLNDG